MKNRILTLVLIFFAVAPLAMAQTITIIHVSNSEYTENGEQKRWMGNDANDGLTWQTPKLTIQDAINSLPSTGGEIWVATGTYYPTEAVGNESQKQFLSFKIPAGVTVRGGFVGYEDSKDSRIKGSSQVIGSYYSNRTVLSGDLSTHSSMTWNEETQQYDLSFSGNSFHVVWMADFKNFADGRSSASGLNGQAVLEGCTITGGNASYESTTNRHHASYGGGIYMTKGAVVENCYVTGCSAARDGGGIFMDGGGTVTHTAVTRCQTLGIGISYGYGGGICAEGNGANTASIYRCGISGCVGRMGGGLALEASDAANKDALKATSCVIVNNTATTEAGGVYTSKGGVLSHLTVARNKCNGSGVYINGVTTGRSAGIYCRDNATIVNSVLWGGTCDNSGDLQYANSRSDKTIQVQMKYVGLSKSNNIDWSSTLKVGVIKVSDYNTKAEATAAGVTIARGEGFPQFTTVPGKAGAYVVGNDADGNPINIGEYNLWSANWDPKANSVINNRGINNVIGETSLIDIRENAFKSRCTLGAYSIAAATIAFQGAKIYNIYVDPDAEAADTDGSVGTSWDNPARFLGDAFDHVIKNSRTIKGTVNIYVKEGTVDNTRSGSGDDIRGCALIVPNNVNVYGSYSASLTGTDLSSRNPVLTPTIITANIDDSYSDNAKVLLDLSSKNTIVFDGFQLRYANNYTDNVGGNGGAISVTGKSYGIKIKNCLFAGCKAANGSAVYLDNSTYTGTANAVSFENCIFHNNSSTTSTNDNSYGIVYINTGIASFDHCDFLNNAGNPIVNAGTGTVTVDNSVFYGNMDTYYADINNVTENNAVAPLVQKGSGVFTSTNKKNLFDGKVVNKTGGSLYPLYASLTDITTPTYYLSYTFNKSVGTTYPLFLNSTKTVGVSSYGYYADETFYGRATSFQPLNLNPMVNAAYYDGSNNFGTDMTTVITRNYGGLPDVGAIENHTSLTGEGEQGNSDGQSAYGDVLYVRDYGTDYTAGGDGYSWQNAINGNAYYYPNGTHGADPSIKLDVEGYDAERVTTFADNEVIFKNETASNYLVLNLTNGAVSSTTDCTAATKFKIVGEAKNNTSCQLYGIDASNNAVAIGYDSNHKLTVGGDASTWTLSGISGGTFKFTYDVTEKCSKCGGTGTRTGKKGKQKTCSDCQGTGTVTKTHIVYLTANGLSEEEKNSVNWQFYKLTSKKEEKYGMKGLQYAVNLASTNYGTITRVSELAKPEVSTSIDNAEHKYNIGMLSGNNASNNNLYFPQSHFKDNVWYMYPTSTQKLSDDFILLSVEEEDDKYYIYDLTKSQYVVYVDETVKGAGKVRLSQTNTTNATWTINPVDDETGHITYTIIPGSDENPSINSLSWNFYGNVSTNATLGFYNGTDANSKWEFWTVPVTTHKEVWVAAGEYSKDPETRAGDFGLDMTGYSTADHDESCYIMRGGVDVYGAFPKTGNPGKEHRNPLVSQYINLASQYQDNKLNDTETYDQFVARYVPQYETILEPVSQTMEEGKVRRVLGPALKYNKGNQANSTGDGLVENNFDGALWDGFTIRKGNVDATQIWESRLNGAAGVAVYQHTTLKNCVVTDNVQFAPKGAASSSHGYRGGGVFVQGGGVVINCYIINNQMIRTESTTSPCTDFNGVACYKNTTSYGAGMYLYYGTVYNCVVANNYNYGSKAEGAGIFVDQRVNFFNNTVVNNKAEDYGNSAACGGIAVFTNTGNTHLTIYNSIIAKNYGKKYGILGDENIFEENECTVELHNCLLNQVPATIGTSSGNTTYNSTVTDAQNATITRVVTTTGDDGVVRTSTSSIEYTNCPTISADSYATLFKSIGDYDSDFSQWNLRLNDNATQAINKGDDMPVIYGQEYDLSTYTDMDYKDRIQDCTIDIGAYEYNDAKSIVPTTETVNSKTIAYYYVTPGGNGLATGTDPANAACADKLQSVLDAAGRYKYAHNDQQVVVKVATYASGQHFQYYAKRTTDTESDDARVYSILVPRGVEVWGGYADAGTTGNPLTATNDDNGFYRVATSDDVSNKLATTVGDIIDLRNIITNQTYFDSYYYNKDKDAYAYTYHVLTFTDKVFDVEGNPYLATDVDASGNLNSKSTYSDLLNNPSYLSLNTKGVTDRSVIDGIFITGGKADVQRSTDYNLKVNINSYGGGAIVTDYAHVRNCVVRDNEGTYGGALALAGHALVSGCLIDQNTAEYGGGIYVFQNGTKLSDGTTVTTSAASATDNLDSNMPHVYTSTIVNNYASTQGGGIWFGYDDANVRVNSSVIWQNDCKDESDVAGLVNPVMTEGDNTSALNFYPFAYSAILSKSVSGVNNRTLKSANADGARFAKDETSNTVATVVETATGFERFKNFGYYKPTTLSALLRRGMSLDEYDKLVASDELSATDFAAANRTSGNRQYIDIGARVCLKELPNGPMMLRIYVADDNDLDSDARNAMLSSNDTFYQQEGSSFANPMTDLKDAIDYIILQRKNAKSNDDNKKYLNADKLPFEIILSQGVYTPSSYINGNSEYTTANTFVIPEGVSIYGGFYSKRFSSDKAFYGRYLTPKDPDQRTNTTDLTANATASTAGDDGVTVNGYTIKEIATDAMLDARATSDVQQMNNIVEPWELQYQTFFNGNPSETPNTGTYHLVTVVPDANVVGCLPPAVSTSSDDFDGETAKEVGQPVVLDGIIFTGGLGHNYQNGAVDELSARNFFQGGAVFVDGNRYAQMSDKGVCETATDKSVAGVLDGVGYRDIPVYIAKCQFINNQAGLGGAIFTNTSTSLLSNNFAENKAEARRLADVTYAYTDTQGSHTTTGDLHYPGLGGAVYYTGKLFVTNSVFANNEALDETYSTTAEDFTALGHSLGNYIGGLGGAMFGGSQSHLYMINCTVVHNQANLYPALFTLNPNASTSTNEVVNTVLWANEQNADMSKTGTYSFAGSQIINFARSNRESAYSFNTTANPVPSSQTDLDANFAESAWFSAYESGRGKTAVRTVNNLDVDYAITANLIGVQNSNIHISSSNNLLEGPSFTNPSASAGYAGYEAGAKWNPMRLSNLADNGSGSVGQSYNSTTKEFEFGTASGLYSAVRKVMPETFRKYLPIGSERYMEKIQGTTRTDINRVSLDYKLNNSRSYIDIGAYEYMYSDLKYSTESDVNVIWVASKIKDNGKIANGESWDCPTTDIQGAIDKLLNLRNGLRKEIRFESEYGGSEFSPMTEVDGNYAFTIDTKSHNETQIIDATQDVDQRYVRCITFKGGYSYNIEGECNVNSYPAIIRGQKVDGVSSDRFSHLFYIKDATQRYGLDDSYKSVLPDGQIVKETFNEVDGYGWWPNDKVKGEGNEIAVIPVEFDGLTMINSQAEKNTVGAAICYVDQKFDTDFNLTTGAEPEYTAVAPASLRLTKDVDKFVDKLNPAKLIISKCKILGSGKESDNTVSAVYVGQYGGNTLIYNSVFHSNYGSPLVAYDAKTINNTFAMNAGKVDLKGTSSVLNSLLWKNNATATDTYGDQFTGAGTSQYNAYTGCASGDENHNESLSNTNSDVEEGPNFVDADNASIEDRDFNTNPAVRVFNQGNSALYNNTLVAEETNNIYDYAMYPSTGVDAKGETRIVNTIDRGAYEFQSTLSRIVYVDPNKLGSVYDGKSWTQGSEHGPMGLSQLQSAIDLAAVYRASSNESAFVLVKGSAITRSEQHTGEKITLRNGVQIYGSLPYSYTTDCTSDEDATIDTYVKTMLSLRDGLASPSARKTFVNGIATGDEVFDIPTVIDGFVVAPSDDDAAVVAGPVVSITPADASTSHLALRNIIVSDFTPSSGDLVKIDNALLYQALIHSNTVASTASVLNLGSKAYAFNVTAEGKTTGTARAYNSILNCDSKKLAGCYGLSDNNLNYQLTEGSKDIDASQSDPNAVLNDAESLKEDWAGNANIAYDNDRDLLGNPRLLTGVSSADKVDNGAFETWRIDQTAVTTKTADNFYPHEGSVVYIMGGNNLVCGTTFTPGYLLVKDGASLYGNGNDVNVAYVAVERANIQSKGSVVSMPFAMDYINGVSVPSVDANGVTSLSHDNTTAYTYNGSARADWKYSFASADSKCWEKVDAAVDANQGVFMVPYNSSKTLRFTAKTTTANTFVYTESASEASKTVSLKAYNDDESSNGGADFTSAEDQGWNCIGLPYLVSNYKPYDTTSGTYMMDSPHKMWLYYDGKTASDGTTAVDGDGGFYSVNSWDSDWHVASDDVARIWAGEGFFVQNERISDAESLLFYRPVYSSSNGANNGAKLSNVRFFTDGVENAIAADAASDVKVYVQKHTLYVQNITDGADIAVYMTNGKAELTDHTENNEYSVTLENGVHIVKVNGKSYKVYVK